MFMTLCLFVTDFSLEQTQLRYEWKIKGMLGHIHKNMLTSELLFEIKCFGLRGFTEINGLKGWKNEDNPGRDANIGQKQRLNGKRRNILVLYITFQL